MSKLDIEWLIVFEEILKTENLSRAAKHLGLTQSAVSKILNNLRKHYGDELFTRTSVGMQPTPFAELIAPNLREAISLLSNVEIVKEAFNPKQSERTFLLAMTDISEIVLLPRLLTHLRNIAPLINISTEPIAEHTNSDLTSGRVDLAIGFAPQLQAGFYQQTLFEQDIVCLAARDHPRIGDTLTIEQFEAERHINVKTPNTGHATVEKIIRDLGVKRKVVAQPSTYLSLAHIVAKTDLLVLVPRLFGLTAMEQSPLKILPAPFNLSTYAVKQVWHSRYHMEPGNRWLRQTLKSLFGETPFPWKFAHSELEHHAG